MKKLEESFEQHMRTIMADVVVNSREWWLCKRAYLGGVGGGLTFDPQIDDPQTLSEALVHSYSEACFWLLVSRMPEEHRVGAPDGTDYINELGVIWLSTELENEIPGDADGIRQRRYLLQKILRETKG